MFYNYPRYAVGRQIPVDLMLLNEYVKESEKGSCQMKYAALIIIVAGVAISTRAAEACDFRGKKRICSDVVDLGCYEYQPVGFEIVVK